MICLFINIYLPLLTQKLRNCSQLIIINEKYGASAKK